MRVDTPWETFSRHWVQLLRWWQVYFCWHRNTLHIRFPPPLFFLGGGHFKASGPPQKVQSHPGTGHSQVTTWPVTNLGAVLAQRNGVSLRLPVSLAPASGLGKSDFAHLDSEVVPLALGADEFWSSSHSESIFSHFASVALWGKKERKKKNLPSSM